jgi:hypothetical protein
MRGRTQHPPSFCSLDSPSEIAFSNVQSLYILRDPFHDDFSFSSFFPYDIDLQHQLLCHQFFFHLIELGT